MPAQELPFLIKPGMAFDSAMKAIQQNFDSLSGRQTQLHESMAEVSAGAVDADEVEEIAATTSGSVYEDLVAAGLGGSDDLVPGDVVATVHDGPSGVLYISWDTLDNTSPVTYKIYVDDSGAYAPGATQYVGEVRRVGQAGFTGLFVLRTFPAGHNNAGTDVLDATTYYVKIVASDEDGSFGGPYTESTGDTGGGSAPSIFIAETILGEHIAAGTITADKMSVDELSSISANVGTLTAGDINGLTITGGTVQTAADTFVGMRARLQDGSNRDSLQFVEWTGAVTKVWGRLDAAAEILSLKGHGLSGSSTTPSDVNITAGDGKAITLANGAVKVTGGAIQTSGGRHIGIGTENSSTDTGNKLSFRTTGGNAVAPVETSCAAIYFDGTSGANGAIRAVKTDGTRVTLGAF